jgi:chemotaxis protein CheD
MSILLVGVGGLAASNRQGEIIKTIALGSCVGAVFHAPRHRAAGLIHIALPDSGINPELAAQRPGYFADTGIPLILGQMSRYGCPPGQLSVKLVGGAAIMDPDNNFNIGRRNLLAVKKILWRYGLDPVGEDVGDNFSRTVAVDVATGVVTITSPGRKNMVI